MSILTPFSLIQQSVDDQKLLILKKATEIKELYDSVRSGEMSIRDESELCETMNELNADLMYENCQFIELQLAFINEQFIHQIHPEQLN